MVRDLAGDGGGRGLVIQPQGVHVQGVDGEDVAVGAVPGRGIGTGPGVSAGVVTDVEGGAVELEVRLAGALR